MFWERGKSKTKPGSRSSQTSVLQSGFFSLDVRLIFIFDSVVFPSGWPHLVVFKVAWNHWGCPHCTAQAWDDLSQCAPDMSQHFPRFPLALMCHPIGLHAFMACCTQHRATGTPLGTGLCRINHCLIMPVGHQLYPRKNPWQSTQWDGHRQVLRELRSVYEPVHTTSPGGIERGLTCFKFIATDTSHLRSGGTTFLWLVWVPWYRFCPPTGQRREACHQLYKPRQTQLHAMHQRVESERKGLKLLKQR